MRSWRTDIHIAAPVQDVWSVLVDLPSAALWSPHARRGEVTATGPLERGTKVTMGRGKGATTLTVGECEPPRLLRLIVARGTSGGESVFVLRESGATTYIEHTLHLQLRGLRRFFTPFIGRSLRTEFRAFCDRVEDRAGRTPPDGRK
ncbi:MAG TPA: SRPBCC family protein [Bacteroidota bacterium]|nr:SRPBCC family protein [Bacteroidota bacterium]